MKRKRIFPLTALVLLFALLASSCGGGKTPAEQTTAATSATATATAATTATTATTEATTTAVSTVEPYTPPGDFNGYVFNVVGTSVYSGQKWTGHTWKDDEPQNALENRLLQEYRNLEKRLNIKFTYDTASITNILASAAAGKYVGDIFSLQQHYWAALAISGEILPLNTDQIRSAGLDVDDPEQVDYYYTQTSKQLDGENVWAIAFSGEYGIQRFGKFTVFNKRILECAGYPADTMYQLVRDGEWTWDKFDEICRAIAQTDYTEYIEENLYPYYKRVRAYISTMDDDKAMTEMYIFTPIVTESNGVWRSKVDSSEFRTAFEKLKSFFDSYDTNLVESENNMSQGNSDFVYFCNNQLGFSFLDSSRFGFEYDSCNLTMEGDYGFLPLPKAVPDGEYVNILSTTEGICIPSAVSDPSRSAYILSQLAEILNDPKQQRGWLRGMARDDESVEMLTEYILPNQIMPVHILSYKLYEVADDLAEDIGCNWAGHGYNRLKSLDEIISTYHPKLQAALDELFEQ